MKEKEIFTEVYNDFFNRPLVSEDDIEVTPEEEVDYLSHIDKLFIKDESKELLKKIISYMDKYNKKEETNYISFNISIDTRDEETLNEITNILKYYSNKYEYVDKNSVVDLSLYKLDTPDLIDSYYNDNSIIVLSDLNSLEMQDVQYKKKFFYLLKEDLEKRKITIISDSKDNIKVFLQNEDRLDKDYFCFNIESINPSVNDVYNEIIEKISSMNLGDEFNIKVLDYITEDYPKSEVDYSTYVNNLYKYISFNKMVPEIEKIKSMEEVFASLNELVGLEKVKKSLNDLVDLITLKNKTKDDLKINNVNLHMVFLGNPGTGKTTVARLISDILYNLKYIKQNKLIEVSSKDLVAEYVGQTAVKTSNVIEKAMGGILFVDEAYSLASKNDQNSYNAEAIATLIKAMEDHRDELVVIFAGYTKEMQDFLDSNSGIVSRIGYTLEFDDYTNDELKQIFTQMVTKAGFILGDGVLDRVDELINENRNTKNFGNARFIRTVYEKTVINHATNTKNKTGNKVLKTITKEDITY